MKNYYKSLIFVIISILLCSTCTHVKSINLDPGNNEEKSAGNVVEQFHKLYNEQNYEEIFNTADEDAKRTKSKEALGLALAQSFEKYGKYLSSNLVYKKITTVDVASRKIELAYKSKFEKGERNETFLIVTNDQKVALYGIGELADEDLEKLKLKAN